MSISISIESKLRRGENQMVKKIFTEISYGREHTLAIDTNGDVYSWGNNDSGQLGHRNYKQGEFPAKVDVLKNIIQVEAGANFSLALDIDGSIWAFGSSFIYPTQPNSTEPTKLDSLKNVKQIAAEYSHGLALLSDGTVWIFGNKESEDSNQCKAKSNISNSAPRKVKNLKDVLSVVAGDYHFLALKADGTVWGGGCNHFGQLGNGTRENQFNEASQVFNLYAVKEIIAGSNHNFAIKTNGEVWGWGLNDNSQLTRGVKTEQTTPILVDNSMEVVQISAGYSHSLMRINDGRVFGWGSNENNQLTSKHLEVCYAPVLLSNSSKAIDIAAGYGYNIMIIEGRSSGEVWGCGINGCSQFGNGTNWDNKKFRRIDAYGKIIKTPTIIGNDEELEF